jgi:hypothetical protein
MNRFCCCGQLHEVVSYVGAYVAVRVDNPDSTISGRMFTRGELFLGILFVLSEIAWFFIEKGTASHWHPTLVAVPDRQSGGSLFRLGLTLFGIHDDKGEEDDEEHGEERKSSKPKREEKKAQGAKTQSKPTKKRKKKTQSDSDNPQDAKLHDKVDELEVRFHSRSFPHRHALLADSCTADGRALFLLVRQPLFLPVCQRRDRVHTGCAWCRRRLRGWSVS